MKMICLFTLRKEVQECEEEITRLEQDMKDRQYVDCCSYLCNILS